MIPKEHEIRAVYNDQTIRVYQAFSDEIADSAINKGTFATPPFKIDRMTWIKPSFLWMMYRSGWGKKDTNQKRILAIDISHDGFIWALKNSCLSHFDPKIYSSKEEWEELKKKSFVTIQWDPERNIFLEKLNYRSIQIGLSPEAVNLYVNNWINKITDITELCKSIQQKLLEENIPTAISQLPIENIYQINDPFITHNLGLAN
jgi:hypothetical protein